MVTMMVPIEIWWWGKRGDWGKLPKEIWRLQSKCRRKVALTAQLLCLMSSLTNLTSHLHLMSSLALRWCLLPSLTALWMLLPVTQLWWIGSFLRTHLGQMTIIWNQYNMKHKRRLMTKLYNNDLLIPKTFFACKYVITPMLFDEMFSFRLMTPCSTVGWWYAVRGKLTFLENWTKYSMVNGDSSWWKKFRV